MKRTKTESIAQIISEVLGEYKIEGKLRESRVIASWGQTLGPLARPDDELYIKNGVLFARISSAAIRNELSMMRSIIIQRLNEEAGTEVITDIVFR